jgi:hypothetical protein
MVEALRVEVPAAFARDVRAVLEAYAVQRRKDLGLALPELGVRHADEFRGLSMWIPIDDVKVLISPLIRAAATEGSGFHGSSN